jgi:hypothetical protein
MKAGVSRNTARKYLRQTDPSKQEKQPHDWRTRKDPLEAVWSAARGMLETAPELEAKALFEHLGERAEGGLEEKVLRTFQRRVRQWRLEHGKEKEVFFSQEARAGAVLAVDWTDMRDLGVSICGVKLDHLMFHAVLPYSNWQWAVRCRSESLLSICSGLKATIGRLGQVTWTQRRTEDFPHIGTEDVGVGRSRDGHAGSAAIQSDRREHRCALPAASRSAGMDALSTGSPAPKPCHIRFGARFVEEDQPRRIQTALPTLPSLTRPSDVGAALLAGAESLFFKVISIFINATCMACREHFRPMASLSSLRLISGFACNKRYISCRCSTKISGLRPAK